VTSATETVYRRPVFAHDGGKNRARLYAIGECIDVTGWLGGYNFSGLGERLGGGGGALISDRSLCA